MTTDAPVRLDSVVGADRQSALELAAYLNGVAASVAAGVTQADAVAVVVQFHGVPEFVGWSGVRTWGQVRALGWALVDEEERGSWIARWGETLGTPGGARESAETRIRHKRERLAVGETERDQHPWRCICTYGFASERGLTMHIAGMKRSCRGHERGITECWHCKHASAGFQPVERALRVVVKG